MEEAPSQARTGVLPSPDKGRVLHVRQANPAFGSIDSVAEEVGEHSGLRAMLHDLAQPLFAIRVLTRTARRGDLDPHVAGLLDQIENQAARASSLLNSARNEGVVDGDPRCDSPTNVAEFLEGWTSRLRPVVEELGVPMELRVSDDAESSWITLGAIDLERVLNNLASNAIEAMRHSPSPAIEVSWGIEGATCVIRVRDSGPGVAPGIGERLFEPHVSTKGPGRGLGLSICREVVNRAGGRIWCDPSEPRGTVFTIQLPTCLPGRSVSLHPGLTRS